MLAHLFNLLGRSLAAIPSVLGSTWFGLIFSLILLVIGEIFTGITVGWRKLYQNWMKVGLRGFSAVFIGYAALLGYCVIREIYSDHQQLNVHIAQLSRQVNAAEGIRHTSEYAIRSGYEQQIAVLRQSCAEMTGANKELSRRAMDQQSTINNCQTQAISLLKPADLKLTAIPIRQEIIAPGIASRTVHWLLLTNKDIPTPHVVVLCNKALQGGSAEMAGGNTISGGTSVGPENMLNVNIDSPALTSTRPMLIDMTYVGDERLACNFGIR